MPRTTHHHLRLYAANAVVGAATETYDDHMVGRRGLLCVVGWQDIEQRTRCSLQAIEAVVAATRTLAAGDGWVELDPA